MEEAGEGGEGGVAVVDEGIKDARGAREGDDIVIGNGCGDEGAVTGFEEDLVARATDAELAVALQTHGDDETVVFAEVAMEGFGDFHHTDIEIRRVDHLDSTVGRVSVCRAVVGLDMKVERLRRQIRMQFARLAIHARTVVVEDAIGDVGGLLHLSQQDAATDGMDTACGEEEHVARLDLMVGKHLRDGAVGDAPVVFVECDPFAEPRIEMRPFVGLDDIPHLRFPHLAMQATRHVVVGMHLDAQVASGIDELHQQWQLTMVFLVDSLAEDGLGMLADDRDQIPTLPRAVADDAGAARHCTHLPALTDGFVGRGKTLIGSELTASPHDGVEVRLEEKRVEPCIQRFREL